jgi:hypothetical protein
MNYELQYLKLEQAALFDISLGFKLSGIAVLGGL